jgi:hypothetical protein
MNNKEIIGYKLIDNNKLTNVNYIVSLEMGTTPYNNTIAIRSYGYCVHGNPDSIKALRNAGVLDIWFKPVYKEEPMPEYVECVNTVNKYWKLGKIYKTDVSASGIYPFALNIIHNTKTVNNVFSWNDINNKTINTFKPSTKEAYDLQNQSKFEVGKWFSKEQLQAINKMIDDKIKMLE